jgi:hypothetical protein
MDLDSYLQSEMEDLNDMFQEFETQDQRKKIRDRDEEEKIMTKVSERRAFVWGVVAQWRLVHCAAARFKRSCFFLFLLGGVS